MSNEAGEAFAKRLLAAVPELTPVYEEHLHDNGEVLGHVLMGAVTRFAIENWMDLRERPASLASLLDFFERELATGDDYACNVIALSFCENLMGEERALGVLRPMMGPHLVTTLKQVFGE